MCAEELMIPRVCREHFVRTQSMKDFLQDTRTKASGEMCARDEQEYPSHVLFRFPKKKRRSDEDEDEAKCELGQSHS